MRFAKLASLRKLGLAKMAIFCPKFLRVSLVCRGCVYNATILHFFSCYFETRICFYQIGKQMAV